MTRNRVIALVAGCCALSAVVAGSPADAGPAGEGDSTELPVGLGPNGEVPELVIGDDEVAVLASATGMSLEESRFILYEGSAAIVDFKLDHLNDPEFGDINVTQDGRLDIQIRVTTNDSDLPRELERALGSSLHVVVGGFSHGELERDRLAITSMLEDRTQRVGGQLPPLNIDTDFLTGHLLVRMHPGDIERIGEDAFPESAVLIEDAGLEIDPMDSFAGAAISPVCTVGFAIRRSGFPNHIVTAAHCQDGYLAASGANLGWATDELCSTYDRQKHSIPSNVYHGFYAFNDVWKNIYAVASTAYSGQNFVRRGKETKAYGQIGSYQVNYAGGGDCPAVYTHGFFLFNELGQSSMPGDSGGVMVLAVNGRWELGGIHSSSGSSVPGADGFDVWRNVPSAWTACTQTTPCTSWP